MNIIKILKSDFGIYMHMHIWNIEPPDKFKCDSILKQDIELEV